MEYTIDFSEEFKKSFRKLKKKDPVTHARIRKKLREIVLRPERNKRLRNVLAGYQRLHFGCLVLVYRVDGDVVKIVALDHHDQAY